MVIKLFPEIGQTQPLSVSYTQGEGKMVASFLYSYVKSCFRELASELTSAAAWSLVSLPGTERQEACLLEGCSLPGVRRGLLWLVPANAQTSEEALGELLHWTQVSSLNAVLTAAPTHFLWFHIYENYKHRSHRQLLLLIVKSLQRKLCSSKGVLVRI